MGLAGVLGAAGPLGRLEGAVGVNLTLEAVEERLTTGCGAGRGIGCHRP